MGCFYDELPLESLVQFYYHINKNIEEGILSTAMYAELELIRDSVEKHGLRIENSYTSAKTAPKSSKRKYLIFTMSKKRYSNVVFKFYSKFLYDPGAMLYFFLKTL